MTNPVLSAESLKATCKLLSSRYSPEGKPINEVDIGGDGLALFNQNHNMTTNNLPKTQGQIWLTTKEAAEIWKTSVRAINKLITTHKDLFTEDEIQGGGSQGKKTYITKMALMKLRNLANIKSKKNTEGYLAKKQLPEKLITKNPEYIEAISKLAQVVQTLEKEVRELKAGKQSQDLSLELLPAPKTTPPDMNLRAALNKFVRDTAKNTNRFYNVVFNELYSQFYYTFSINLVSRAKKNGMSVIEYAEKYGHIQDLYDLARKIYSIKK